MGHFPELVGVIHLPPLPGAPGAFGTDSAAVLANAGAWAVKEAKILVKAGFDGIILENFGDIPFYKTSVPPETVASLAVLAAAIRESVPRVQLGINVLRNDAKSSLAVAAVTGADFIRVNVLSGVSATDQGIIEGCAAEILRERLRLNAGHVRIFADVHVKHALSLSSQDLAQAIEEVSGRGGADAIIVSGATTGRLPDLATLKVAVERARDCKVPLYLGSGASLPMLESLHQMKIKIIVGSALRQGGRAGFPLDAKRTKAFALAFKKCKKMNARISAKRPAKSKKTLSKSEG